MKKALLHLFFLFITVPGLFAQPSNDDCINAISIPFAVDESSATRVAGDTRDATASGIPLQVCSGSFYTDDIWFSFITPDSIPLTGIEIRAYFDTATIQTDVLAIGMAIYKSCDSNEIALRCFSSEDPNDHTLVMAPACLQPGHEYVIRVWSTGNTPSTEGTFSMAVFGKDSSSATILWEETFGDSLDGWTTYGMCANPDSNHLAAWQYLPNGLLDRGSYIFSGFGLNSETLCDGAVGIDSDYNDSNGNAGIGPCLAPSIHVLESPVIYSGDWLVPTIYLAWTQAIRQYQSEFFIAYRGRFEDEPWEEWREFEVNQEFPVNGDAIESNYQSHLLYGATVFDSLQVRFTYHANYYLWGIDDVRLHGYNPPCTDLRFARNAYALAPFVEVPWGQAYPFPAMGNVYNAGSCLQTNVNIHHKVISKETGEVIYSTNVSHEALPADSSTGNILFPELIYLDAYSDVYHAEYSISQDSIALNPMENIKQFEYAIGGHQFAHEDGFTRDVAVSNNLYMDGAPLSYGYGNVFRAREWAYVMGIEFGIANPADMADKTISYYLLEWSDTNQDQIAQVSERDYVGFGEYTFTGMEGDNVMIHGYLENFNEPGNPVFLEAGNTYLAMVEYKGSPQDQIQLFMLASDERDFTTAVIASDTAFARGLVDQPTYMTALQFSPDGIIDNIDFQVRELDPNDNLIHFGDDIVPCIRLMIGPYDYTLKAAQHSSIEVSPNPASTSVTIAFNNKSVSDHTHVELCDSKGIVRFSKNMGSVIPGHTETLDVTSLLPGIYRLTVRSKEIHESTSVIIAH